MEELSSEALYGKDFGAEQMWGLKELIFQTERFTPQTIAWTYVGALLIALLLILSWRRYQVWKNQAYRREALKSLTAMQLNSSLITGLPQLLRYAALMSFPRIEVSSLSGTAWIKWLNQSAGMDIFSEEDALLLKLLAYSKITTSTQQNEHLIHAAETWIKVSHV